MAVTKQEVNTAYQDWKKAANEEPIGDRETHRTRVERLWQKFCRLYRELSERERDALWL